MRARTKINQRSASISGSKTIFRNLALDELGLERVVFEHFKGLLFVEKDSFKRLFFLNVFLDLAFNFVVVLLRHFVIANKGVIEEPAVQRWSMTEPCSIVVFKALS